MLKKERLIISPLEFLGKNATFPQYVLILVDLFSSKVYTFPMRSSIRMDRYNKKKYSEKRKKSWEDLKTGERVYLLAERIKKKSAPGKFYKQSVQNISYFNKETVYTIRKKQLIDGIRYYWVRSPINDLPKRFLRTEIFALKSNFNLKKVNIKKKKSISKKTSISKK